MGWIDVAIPGVIGLLLVLAPGLFTKSTGDEEKDARKAGKTRVIGAVLLGVAALYMVIKMASAR